MTVCMCLTLTLSNTYTINVLAAFIHGKHTCILIWVLQMRKKGINTCTHYFLLYAVQEFSLYLMMTHYRFSRHVGLFFGCVSTLQKEWSIFLYTSLFIVTWQQGTACTMFHVQVSCLSKYSYPGLTEKEPSK